MRFAMRHLLILKAAAGFVALSATLAVPARADAIRAVSGFTSTTAGNATKSDRSFVETGFVGTSFKFNASNIGQFRDGSLTNSSGTYAWNDVVPSDFGSGNTYPQNPDRGDLATPFSNEGSGGAALREVFESSNLAYLLDGESNVAWTLDLLYGPGQSIIADGDDTTMDLLFLERGANSMLGVRAIRTDGTLTDAVILNFRLMGGSDYGVTRNGGLTDFSLDTLEINSAQQVSGIGVDLSAFGILTGQSIKGIQVFALKDTPNLKFDGPDFLGFVASQRSVAVPEPSSIAMALIGGSAFGLIGWRRRRRDQRIDN